MNIIQLQTINAAPAKRLNYVPTEKEIIARLRKRRDDGDKEKAEERQAAWDAWVADTKERGVIEPVKVIKLSLSLWEVVDGRNRLAAAKEAGLTHIPAIEVTEGEATGLIISTLAHRKGVSKGSLAYLALTFYPHLASGKPGRKSRNDCGIKSLEELASAIGVSLRTTEDAAHTFRHFEDHPKAKADYESLVIAGEKSLQDARKLSGLAGRESTQGKERRPSTYASAAKTVRSLSSQLREADKWAEEDREAAVISFGKVFTGLAPAAREILSAALRWNEEGGES